MDLKRPSKSSVSAQRSTFRISFRPAVCGEEREAGLVRLSPPSVTVSPCVSPAAAAVSMTVSASFFPPAALAPQAVRPRHKAMTMGRSTDAENLDDRFFFIKPFPSKIHRPFC